MSPIKLNGDCSIYEISSIHQQVMKSWKGKSALTLDLSRVSEIDASFIQLLMSCKQTAEQEKQSFELLNASDKLTQTIDAMFSSVFFNPTSEQTASKEPELKGV